MSALGFALYITAFVLVVALMVKAMLVKQEKSIIKMFKELPLVAFIISIFWPHDKD